METDFYVNLAKATFVALISTIVIFSIFEIVIIYHKIRKGRETQDLFRKIYENVTM